MALLLSPSIAHAQRQGGTLVWLVEAEPAHLDAHRSVLPLVAQIAAKIYDGLLDYGPDRQPRPALAESWRVAPDGRTITFYLRPDVTFHDGKPLTSADVQFTILEVLKKFHPRGTSVFRPVTAIGTPDAHTAVLMLSEPAPYLLTALAAHESPILPKHLLAGSDPRGSIANPIGTGPFKLAAWTKGTSLRLERHAKYWRAGRPFLDAIEVRFQPDAAARASLLDSGAVHLAGPGGVDTDTARRFTSHPVYRVNVEGADALTPIAELILNTTRPPFDKPRVRQAIAYAIDRPAAIAGAWHGFGRPAAGPLHSAFLTAPASAATANPYAVPDAVERANQLLDAAGLPRREDGMRFSVLHDVAPFGPEWQRLGEVVETHLARVGIKAGSRYETIEAWLHPLSTGGDFTLASNLAYGLSDPAIGLHRRLHGAGAAKPTAFGNVARWRNREADALMDLAATETDPPSRTAHYDGLQKLVLAESPVVWIAELTPPALVHRTFRQVVTAPLGLYANFADAWLDATALAAATPNAAPPSPAPNSAP